MSPLALAYAYERTLLHTFVATVACRSKEHTAFSEADEYLRSLRRIGKDLWEEVLAVPIPSLILITFDKDKETAIEVLVQQYHLLFGFASDYTPQADKAVEVFLTVRTAGYLRVVFLVSFGLAFRSF